MPIEFVKSTIEAPKPYYVPLERPQTAHSVDDQHFHLMGADESHIDKANADLRQTMKEIEEVKMYRTIRPRKGQSSQGQKPDSKRRVLVGAEFNRFIVSKEKAKIDKININLKRFHDPVLDVMDESMKELDKNVKEAIQVSYQSKQLHKGDDPQLLDSQRKHLLLQSEERRKSARFHPTKVGGLATPRAPEDYVNWALESSAHEKGNLENDLMHLEKHLRKEADNDYLDTSSSDDGNKYHPLYKKKKASNKKYLERFGEVRENVG